jgi:putative phage-type endonuclease
MTEHLEQRTDAWLQARVGKVTASGFKHVLARNKPTAAQAKAGEPGNPSAARTTYLWQQVIERLTGQPAPVARTMAMQWGTDQEPAALQAYNEAHLVNVEAVGFVQHPTLAVGCSPDGLVTEDMAATGLVEIKCPFNSANHLETWLSGMPEEHMAQVQGQMWLTGREWCDFVSFDPRMPDDLQLYVQRVQRNPEYIAGLEREIITFLSEVDAIVQKLQAKTSF